MSPRAGNILFGCVGFALPPRMETPFIIKKDYRRGRLRCQGATSGGHGLSRGME